MYLCKAIYTLKIRQGSAVETMRYLYPLFLICLLGLISVTGARASHISGINISYESLGGNDYRVTVNMFRDCQDLNNLPANLNVFITSSCAAVGYLAFPQISLTDVSQLCPEDMPESKCNGGTLPGNQLGVYQLDVSLPPCSDWRIIVTEQNRDIATQNLINPSSHSIHVEARLNNQNAPNTSPSLSLLNLPHTCVSNPFYYNLGFTDPEGDSLVYAFVPAQASNSPVSPYDMSYPPPYSASEPIPGITIDPHTGQIQVTPTMIGKFNVVVEVREYRNGIQVGMVVYDFLIVVNLCAVPPPAPVSGSLQQVSGGGYPLDENTIGICPEDDFCFQIDFSSQVAGINVTLSSNIDQLIPGATESVSGTNPATITFCGTLPPGFNGGSFIITATDDVCPLYGQAYYSLDFQFRSSLQAFADTTVCLGVPVTLSAINDTSYTWSTLSGNALTPGSDISCNPCSTAEVSPDTTTTYVVTGAYEGSTCSNSDTLTVSIPLRTEVVTSNESCPGNDGIIDINILTGSGNYTVTWNDIGTGPLSRNNLTAGTYMVTITDNVYGCSREDTFTLIQEDPPVANGGTDQTVCGLSTDLSAVPSYGVAQWSGPPGVIFADPANPSTQVSVPGEGSYTLAWTENGGPGCAVTDSVTLDFYALPVAEINHPDSVCGLIAEVDAGSTPGSFLWEGESGLSFSDIGAQLTEVSAAGYGTEILMLTVQNGPCQDSDTASIRFIETPQSDAGNDVNTCGTLGVIAAVDGIGSAIWILPPGLSSSGDLTQESVTVETSAYGVYDVVRSVTNEGFCNNTDTTQIRFTEIPEVELGGDFGVCDSTAELTFTLPPGNLSWELSAGLNSITAVTSPTQFSGNYGAHQIILHADNGYGCVNADTLNLYFSVQPELGTVTADTVCGLNTPLNGEVIADNQFWLPHPGAAFSDLSDPATLVTVDSQGQYTFLWVAENIGGCRDTAQVPVRFYDQPVSNAGADQLICGLNTQLSATASYGNFIWKDQPGLTFADPLSPTTQIEASWFGIYSVQMQEINGICTDSAAVEIAFYSTPEIQNPQWICTGIDAEFILTFDLAFGDTSQYLIEGVDGELNNLEFTSDSLASNTPIEVWFSDNGPCGGDTLTGTQFCPVLTSAGQMNPDTVRLCGNDWIELDPAENVSLDGNDTLLYAIYDGNPGSLTSILDWNTSPEFGFLPGMVFDQTYYISSVAGNASAEGIDLSDPLLSVSPGTPVEFYQPPQSEISGEFTVCPYDTVWIPVSLGGAMPQELTWSIGGQTSSAWVDSGFEIMVTDSGDINLISTHSEFCQGSVIGTARVEFYTLPTATVSATPEICSGDTGFVSIHFTGSGPFTGTLLQNGGEILSFNSLADSVVVPSATGGNFVLTDFSDIHCANSTVAGAVMNVKPLPEVDAGEDAQLCAGDTAQLGTAALPGQQYTWSNDAGLLSANSAQVVYAAESNSPFPESHTLYLTAERNGCFLTDTLHLTVNPLPVPQIIGSSTLCSNDSLSLIGYGGSAYLWEPAQYFSNSESIQAWFSAADATEIFLTAINEAGCEATTSRQIEVLQSPDSTFAISVNSGCAPLPVEMTILNPGEGYHYDWIVGNVAGLADAPYLATLLKKAGLYPVSVQITAPNGCSSSMKWPEPVRVLDTHAAFTWLPEKPDITHPEIFFRNLSPQGVSSYWEFDTLSASTGRDAAFTFPAYIAARYDVCLTVTDSTGCEARVCRELKLEGKRFVYVPSAFTPNGDGLNDFFHPVLANVDVAEYHFWVTNGRGQIIFETRDPHAKWDGSSNKDGYYAENRIYNWFLVVKPDFNVETEYLQGSVTLIR